MLDRDDWEDLRRRKTQEKTNGRTWSLEFLAQAEVHQKNLTGQPEWDRFLSYLTEFGERLEAERAAAKDALLAPETVNHDDVMRLKLVIADLGGMIRCLNTILALPRDIVETGEKAREKLLSQ